MAEKTRARESGFEIKMSKFEIASFVCTLLMVASILVAIRRNYILIILRELKGPYQCF